MVPEFSYIRNIVEVIVLDNNLIRYCGSLCDNVFAKLSKVMLSFNSIFYMNVTEILMRWPNIKDINVANNQLMTLSGVTASADGRNSKVWLVAHNNPYCCNGSMTWMLKGMKDAAEPAVVFGRVKIFMDVIYSMACYEPEHLQGFPIWKLGNIIYVFRCKLYIFFSVCLM